MNIKVHNTNINMHDLHRFTQCHMLCLDCSVVDCAVPICARGYELFTPEGECCSQCRRGKYMAHTIFSLPSKCQLVLITILQTLTILYQHTNNHNGEFKQFIAYWFIP